MSDTSGSMLYLLKKAMTGAGMGKQRVKNDISIGSDNYKQLYDQKDLSMSDRKNNAQSMVSTFYDLVTDFYEAGWGQSFHFAQRGPTETFRESIIRHEHYISMQLNINDKDYVLDLGCGIGGPMRNICQFTNAKIVGVTINQYQVERGNSINDKVGLSELCELRKMDFLDLQFEDNTFDKIFSIEATCHAPERQKVFAEALRVLKPGGLFASYEWVVTPKYDPNNPKHVEMRQRVEKGNSLPELISDTQAIEALQKVGFELILAEDLVQKSKKGSHQIKSWYHSMQAGFNLETLHHTKVGTFITHNLCWLMEKLRLAPKGTFATHQILQIGKQSLIDAGQEEIFTPMLLLVARKPFK